MENIMKLGIQLYTLRDIVNDDFKGLLKKVSKLGYKSVEFAGFYDLSANEIKDLCNNLNLDPTSAHIGVKEFEEKQEETIRFLVDAGIKNVAIPYNAFETKESILLLADSMNKLCPILKENKISLSYHNHSNEFKMFDGKLGLDILFENTVDEIGFELDVYWIAFAGFDPVEIINKYKQRCFIIHLKDMIDSETKTMCPAGNGIIDMKTIIDSAKSYGTKIFIYEQDFNNPDPLDTALIALNNMSRLI
jgi:sugar phosphate isomerase/epimerase